MAGVQRSEAPPRGEEVHLPEPTIVPLLLAAGITTFLLGLTTTWVLLVAGGALALYALVAWVRGARRELSELPPGD